MNARAIRRLLRAASATACAALLAAGTLSASPAVAVQDPDTSGFVPTSSVPVDQLARFNSIARSHGNSAGTQTGTVDAAPTPAAAGALADDPGLDEECAKHPEADSPTGWIKNRFETCVHRHYDLALRTKDGSVMIGRLRFDAWVLGFAYDGQRKVDYVVSVKDIIDEPVPGEDSSKWTISQDVNVGGQGPGSVTKPAKQSRVEPIGSWKQQPLWTLTYTSPDNGPLYDQGDQQIVNADMMLSMGVTSPSAPNIPWSDFGAAKSNVRFDYAGPIAGKHKGTVFTNARVELVMKLSDPAVRESARHIADAQNNPERTFPSFNGKTIPGAKEPLHRLVDREAQKKNRAAAIKTCEDIWGDYTKSGLECDEYPFASTYEGANSKDSSGNAVNRYSARLIDGDDNGKGGNMIGEVYSVNRLLDNDPFYVKIIP
ncbi:NucA/NucB deoxyribonuclease domain-containing protein [Kitasatospora sp. NPDC004669]|uniref:NucA/NucB deoxyribonuclease domain-containing protein n=1 Tax=Kitasatospora sp. NPDC004669 TaxID=3154555 RepID=UPI0033A8C0DF